MVMTSETETSMKDKPIYTLWHLGDLIAEGEHTRETFDNFIAEGMQMVEDAYSEGLAHGSAEIYSTKDGDDRVWCFDQEDLKKHLLQAQAPEVGDRNEDAYIDQYHEDKYDLGDFNYDTSF